MLFLAFHFNSSEAEWQRCLRGPAPALETEGNAEEPRMPSLGLGSDGAAVGRKAKRRSRLGRRRSGDGRRDSPIYYSSDRRSSSGNVYNGEAGGSVTDGGDHNDLPLTVLGHAGGGPPADPDPETRPFPCPVGFPPPKNRSKVTAEDFVQREVRVDEEGNDEVKEEGEVVSSLASSKHSFPHPPRECQSQQCRSEEAALTNRRKLQRRRPVSLDFNGQGADASVMSPRFFIGLAAGMKKSSADSSWSRSGILQSPGTPNYRHGVGVAVYQKGWSSERVPLPVHSSCRRDASRVILPFANGRTLPSKWEDAERWIFSPVSIDGAGRSPSSLSHYRRPKSKSGPLGPQAGLGLGSSYSLASPVVPCFDSGRAGSITANSPFLAGVLIPEQDFYHNGNRGRRGGGGVCSGGIGVAGVGAMCGKTHSTTGDPYIFRSASIHGWSENAIESSSSIPSSRDEKSDGSKEEASVVSISTSRKDVATQMGPDGSTFSSPNEGPSSPSPVSAPAIVELESHFSKIEVRDVQVDNHVTLTRWSRKHIAQGSDRQSASIAEWKKTIEGNTTWEVTETAKCISRYKREEAKITAWENLQKAKAEAEIRKLEMKLEKKRSSSMEKILSKLQFAQKKAQEMRSALTTSRGNQATRTMKKVSYLGKTGQISSLSGCFTCHAFGGH
ncbi:uncharacterized protein LOC122051529 [Zingiber officinale]|uniref:uncharacterized protein LOC122051529 n=1 Tax=Zingiber officinale TaxID=94328 RepID=UPI001C4BC101|nr:uncharacterized protein LOC122051529 [Zingiber officinale]